MPFHAAPRYAPDAHFVDGVHMNRPGRREYSAWLVKILTGLPER